MAFELHNCGMRSNSFASGETQQTSWNRSTVLQIKLQKTLQQLPFKQVQDICIYIYMYSDTMKCHLFFLHVAGWDNKCWCKPTAKSDAAVMHVSYKALKVRTRAHTREWLKKRASSDSHTWESLRNRHGSGNSHTRPWKTVMIPYDGIRHFFPRRCSPSLSCRAISSGGYRLRSPPRPLRSSSSSPKRRARRRPQVCPCCARPEAWSACPNQACSSSWLRRSGEPACNGLKSEFTTCREMIRQDLPQHK